MKPVIIMTAGTEDSQRMGKQIYLFENYAESIRLAGGIPLVISAAKEKEQIEEEAAYLSETADGLVITGGADIHPAFYDEEDENNQEYDIKRDYMEYCLCKAFMEKEKPVLGICRGLQMINVACGGTLYQAIEKEYGDHHAKGNLHTVTVERESWFFDNYGEKIIANSYHHQAAKKIGTGLKVIAKEEKTQVVEALEHEKLPVFAVQWHPERMCGENPFSKGTDEMLSYFQRFIEYCKKMS